MIYFLIPVFNEFLNIPDLYNNLTKILNEETKFYVFVDDYSTDDTIKLIREYFKEHSSSYHVINKDRNIGPGDSFNQGFNWILDHSKNNSDIVVTLEGDNTSDLNILPDMISISKMGYHLVLASPYAQGGGFEQTTVFRKLASFSVNMLLKFLYNIRVLTLSSFYRVYSIDLLMKLRKKFHPIIEEDGFACMFEILVKSINLNIKIIEVPMMLHSSKRKGKSKMQIAKTVHAYSRLLIRKKY